ncbi:MAG: hypothetical protein GTO63_16830, partial [Anaerolineae bacterium]|nr:hypothetical protein [Anaerolineae bacterium]NIN96463.1 hypothetical protein [Anaerolineae bacterium]
MDASPFTSVALSRQERTVLGVRAKEISLGDLDSRYADYTDYLRHMRDLDAPVLRSVGAAAQDESVLRELYGTGYRFRTMTRLHRGSEVFNNWKKAVRAVDDLMRGVDPFTGKNTAARAQVDLVRLAARTIDPLPWLYATANVPGGLLRASVGMTSAGRQDLAQQLYLRMKGPEFREKFNRRYMRNQLGEFPAPISIRPQDIYEALIP